MWFPKALRALPFAALLSLILWACHVTGEDQAFLNVRADSSWTSFDEVAVVLAEKDGTPIDTLFKGHLTSPDQLKKLPAGDYDGREVQVILIGINDGKPAKTETRKYDGRTQTETAPKVVVIIPIDGGPGDGGLDLKPDTLRLYVGGPSAALAPAGTSWTGKSLDWSSSDPKIATVDDGAVQPVAAGQCWIRAASGKSGDSSRVTVVLDAPVLDAGTDTAVLLNASVAFKVRVQQEFGGVSAFKWSLDGDSAWDDSASGMPAQAAVLETPARKFAQAGTLVLRFLVRDGEGNESVAQRTLVVSSQVPRISSLPKDTALTAGDSLAVSAKADINSGALKKYAWNFGDGSAEQTGSLAGKSVTVSGGHRFAKEGAFKVILTVEDDAGTAVSAFFTVTVKAKAVPKAPIAHAGKDTSVIVNTAVHLHGSASDSDGTIAKLEWSIGGGAFAAASGDTTFTPTTAGTVRCILRATDDAGLIGLDTLVVTVSNSQPPVISAFTPPDTLISINDSVTFTAKMTGTAALKTYSWDFDGDGTADESGTLSAATASLKTGKRYAAAGTFAVAFKVTDVGGASQTRKVNVVVETDPPTADAGKDTSVMAGTRVNLHGKAGDKLGKIVSVAWKIGAGAFTVTSSGDTGFTASATPGKLVCIFRATDDDGLTAQDTVAVTITPKPSSNAKLANLVLSAAPLTPPFIDTTTAYTASVANAVSSTKVTPTAADSGAAIKVNGVAVPSGTPSASIPLPVGKTAIIVDVTAADGTKKSYTVSVTRAAADTNAALSNLAPSRGSLSPVFNASTLSYSVTVNADTAGLALTPTAAAGSRATITVAGSAVASGTASPKQALAFGLNSLAVVVTAEDGITKRTYTVQVNRKSYESTCALAVEDCLAVNPANLTVSSTGTSYQLLDGDHLINTFPGTADGQAEANQVKSVIQFYKLNQECFVGRGTSGIMQYWKKDGEVPSGAFTGEDCNSITAGSVTTSATFQIIANGGIMEQMSTDADAKQGACILNTSRVSQECFVGRPGASLLYYRR